MPLYEYQCQQCHRRVERIQSFSAEPLRVCEHCGGELVKLISAPAIQFKGSGWYVTDYAGKKPAASESKPDTKSDSKPESKPESKSESSTESKPSPPSSSTS